MRIVFDETTWPMVRITMRGPATTEEFEAYLERRTRLLDRSVAHVTVLDARQAVVPTKALRELQARWIREHEHRIRAFSRGIAYVFESSSFRFVLSSIFVLSPPPSPYLVTASIDEAVQWARQCLDARSLAG